MTTILDPRTITEATAQGGRIIVSGEDFANHVLWLTQELAAWRTKVITLMAASGTFVTRCTGMDVTQLPLCKQHAAQMAKLYAKTHVEVIQTAVSMARLLGADWPQLAEQGNKAELIRRLRLLRADFALQLYRTLAYTVYYAHATQKLDDSLKALTVYVPLSSMLWDAIKTTAALGAAAFEKLLNGATYALERTANTLAQIAGKTGGALLSGLWEGIKPFIIPVVLIGGVFLVGRHLLVRRASNVTRVV